jgi:hypothetical protein
VFLCGALIARFPQRRRPSLVSHQLGIHLSSKNESGRELALVPCRLFGDDECGFLIDYAQEDRGRAHQAIIESNLNMGKRRGLKACVEEITKENETTPLNLRILVHNGGVKILGLVEEEKARLGEARFKELELVIAEMELYGGHESEPEQEIP